MINTYISMIIFSFFFFVDKMKILRIENMDIFLFFYATYIFIFLQIFLM